MYNIDHVEMLYGLILTVYVLSLIISLIMYIFMSIGLHKIGKLRGMKYSWIAWIPIANVYNIGRIADAYSDRIEHKKTNMRIILLVLEIVILVMMPFMINFQNTYYTNIPIMVVYWAILILLIVFEYICFYRIYKWCTANYVLFLVLSIVIIITMPFLLFAIRNNVNPDITGKKQ